MAVNVDGSETNMREKEVKRDRRMHCTAWGRARRPCCRITVSV